MNMKPQEEILRFSFSYWMNFLFFLLLCLLSGVFLYLFKINFLFILPFIILFYLFILISLAHLEFSLYIFPFFIIFCETKIMGLALDDYFMLLIIVIFAMSSLGRKFKRKIPPWIICLSVLFILIILFSSINMVAFSGWLSKESVKGTFNILTRIAFVFVISIVLNKNKYIRANITSLNYFLFTMVLFSVLLILNFGSLFVFRRPGAVGALHIFQTGILSHLIFYNPNIMSRTVLFILPFCISTFIETRKLFNKIILMGLVLISVFLCFATLSRMVALTLAFVMFLYFLFDKRIRKTAAFILTFIGILALFIISPFMERFLKIDFSEIQNEERYKTFEATIDAWSKKPLLGYGPNTYQSVMDKYGLTSRINPNIPKGSHNNFLTILLHFGLVGEVIFILLVLSLFLLFKKFNLKKRDRFETYKLAGFLSFISIILTGMTAGNLGQNIVWFVLGLTIALHKL